MTRTEAMRGDDPAGLPRRYGDDPTSIPTYISPITAAPQVRG